MFRAFRNGVFQFLIFFGVVSTSFWNWTLLDVFQKKLWKLSWGQKSIFRAFENNTFQILQIFEWLSWNQFLGKLGKNVEIAENCLSTRLVIGKILKIDLEATFRLKVNVLSIWIWHFQRFCKFWIDEV